MECWGWDWLCAWIQRLELILIWQRWLEKINENRIHSMEQVYLQSIGNNASLKLFAKLSSQLSHCIGQINFFRLLTNYTWDGFAQPKGRSFEGLSGLVRLETWVVGVGLVHVERVAMELGKPLRVSDCTCVLVRVFGLLELSLALLSCRILSKDRWRLGKQCFCVVMECGGVSSLQVFWSQQRSSLLEAMLEQISF